MFLTCMCALMAAYQAFERFAYFGVSANLVIYMTSELHKDLVSAVTSVNNWSGTAWITPIVGAYIADSHLGRFWTITFALLIYAMVSCRFFLLLECIVM